jgi:hypothetical protein
VSGDYERCRSMRSVRRTSLETKLDEVSALRRGDIPALRRREMPTLTQLLVDEYIAQHRGRRLCGCPSLPRDEADRERSR